MNVLVAIDSWKGCLTSREVNEAVRCALLSVNPDVNVRCIPVSDGGEGFLDAVEATGNYRRHIVPVHDPLMRLVEAPLLSCGDHFVAELSSASGLSLLQPEERNPLVATSYGTGELIAHAIRLGARSLTLGLGGSAISDCGQGMLKALEEESKGGILKSFSPQVLQSLDFTLATDVTNPLLGPEGAVYTFARQKAAPSLSPKALSAMLAELEFRASAFAVESARLLGHDFSTSPGAGAAGGVGYALMQYYGARRVSGVDYLLDLAHFDNLILDADLIITGEGRADRQTLMGKLPYGILRRALSHAVPVLLLTGQVSDTQALLSAGFSHVLPVTPPDMPLSEALRPDVARRNIMEAIKIWHFSRFSVTLQK